MNSNFLKGKQTYIPQRGTKWPSVSLSECIKEINIRNSAEVFGANAARGISTNKELIDTKANLNGVKLSAYKIVRPQNFAFVADTSRRGDKMSIALNHGQESYLVSSISTVFEISDHSALLPEYLYLQFKRSEFDRYARFNSWGSARETFDWDDLCRVKIPLPPIKVQQGYVDAYQGLRALIEENEALLKSLDVMTQACVAECREKWPMKEIGTFIQETDYRNTDGNLGLDSVRGISIQKDFIQTKADMEGVSLRPYKIVSPREFAYVTVTSRNGNKISIAMNLSTLDFLVSSSYETFRVKESSLLEPEYLNLQFKRVEFDRYTRFNSWGSARETFNWDDMCRVKIPLPPIEVQRAIVALYHCAEEARNIAEEAKAQLARVCPAMIQRAAHCF